MKITYSLRLFSLAVLLYTFSLNGWSQVTIGSSSPPEAGALLQLKETDGLGANSTKGLGFPRVVVTDLKSLIDVGEEPGTGQEHIGLIIYSAQNNYCGLNYIYQGIHIWNGTEWQFLGNPISQSPEILTFTDPRDGEKYRYRDFGPVAGVWMLDDIRAFVYDGTGAAPILSGADQEGSGTNKQYVYPAPYGDGLDPIYYLKQPAIGILYNWPAAVNIGAGGIVSPGDVNEGENGLALTTIRQGICPSGWHVPSDMEWNDIESVIAQSPTTSSTNSGTTWDNAWRTMTLARPDTNINAHGRSMKSPCVPIAAASRLESNGQSWLPELGGFNIMLVGDLLDESMKFFGEGVSFWSSSSAASGSAWSRTFRADSDAVRRGDNNRARLYSVRCKRD